MRSPEWYPGLLADSEPMPLFSLNLTGFRITQKAHLWTCLHFLHTFDGGANSYIKHGQHQSMDWGPRRCKRKGRKPKAPSVICTDGSRFPPPHPSRMVDCTFSRWKPKQIPISEVFFCQVFFVTIRSKYWVHAHHVLALFLHWSWRH